MLDHLVDATLVDPQLEGDLLLGHLGVLVEDHDLLRQIGRHLTAGHPTGRRHGPLGAIPLLQFLQHGEGEVHPLLAQRFFEFLERRHDGQTPEVP